MKQLLLSIIAIPALFILLYNFKSPETHPSAKEGSSVQEVVRPVTISGIVRNKETLDSIFSKYNLDKGELFEIYDESRGKYDLSKLTVGSIYSFELDESEKKVQRMQYGIDDRSFLTVKRIPEGFSAERVTLPINRRVGFLSINIKDNLASSMPGTHKEYLRLALELSDIYAWDIDFFNDIRNGDSVKIIVEELWIGEVFKGYGNILAALFNNSGTLHSAYRFEHDGYADYYDSEGKSLKKTLLKSPLKFKYISSRFSKSRLHPKLRIYRPHLGVDYAAPAGTPVSAAGNGTVVFTGRKGQMGKMVRIKHPGGYETYYGHLSRIPKNIRKNVKVSQNDVIGYVGSTGLATGPHLDYRIKLNGKFVNPLTVHLPRGTSIAHDVMAEFKKAIEQFEIKLGSMPVPAVASQEKKKKVSG